jgi:hypothetical protein
MSKAKSPIMCPFCGKGVKQEPFYDTFAEDKKDWFFIRSEEDPSALVGDMQRWSCVENKKHIFFHSTDNT